jgi:hypothetical protein
MKLIEVFRKKYQVWQFNREFKKSGYTSAQAYLKTIDSDVCYRATTISTFYSGYPYVFRMENYPEPFNLHLENINQWGNEYCKDKWRMDWHRIDCYFDLDGNIYSISEDFNDFFGSDFMFVAFKNERDYNWFLLKWS